LGSPTTEQCQNLLARTFPGFLIEQLAKIQPGRLVAMVAGDFGERRIHFDQIAVEIERINAIRGWIGWLFVIRRGERELR